MLGALSARGNLLEEGFSCVLPSSLELRFRFSCSCCMVCQQYIWVGTSGVALSQPCAQRTQVFSELVAPLQTWWPPCHGPSEVDTTYLRPHACSAPIASACLHSRGLFPACLATVDRLWFWKTQWNSLLSSVLQPYLLQWETPALGRGPICQVYLIGYSPSALFSPT